MHARTHARVHERARACAYTHTHTHTHTLGYSQGVLLYGPPGTGKTLLARAVANRTDACFIRVIGSELVQKYVGEGARMVHKLFEMARSKKVRLTLAPVS